MVGVIIMVIVIFVLVGEVYLVYIDWFYFCLDFNNYVVVVYKVLGIFLFGVVVS